MEQINMVIQIVQIQKEDLLVLGVEKGCAETPRLAFVLNALESKNEEAMKI
jgi:hypothetical protein